MTLVRYNQNDFGNLWRTPSIFDNAFEDLLWGVLPTRQKSPSTVQVRDLDDHTEISIAAPGLDKGDFDVSLKNEHLTVSYEKSIDDNPRLFSKQAFSKSWSVPRGTKMKDVSAKYDAGILTVSVKKSKKTEPKAYSIKIA